MCREIATMQNIFVTNLPFEASDQRAIDNPSYKSGDCHHCCNNSCLGFVITRMQTTLIIMLPVLKMLLCSTIIKRMLITAVTTSA